MHAGHFGDRLTKIGITHVALRLGSAGMEGSGFHFLQQYVSLLHRLYCLLMSVGLHDLPGGQSPKLFNDSDPTCISTIQYQVIDIEIVAPNACSGVTAADNNQNGRITCVEPAFDRRD